MAHPTRLEAGYFAAWISAIGAAGSVSIGLLCSPADSE